MMKPAMLMIAIILLSSAVLGLGLAPAKKDVMFAPGGSEVITYRVYNTENTAFTADITLNGTLSDYITLSNDTIDFRGNEKFKEFNLTVKMPQKLSSMLFADITVKKGSVKVPSRLTLSKGGLMPTGSVVQQTSADKTNRLTNYVLPAALILIIFANIVYFATGKLKTMKPRSRKHPKTAEEALAFLKKIDIGRFREFVTPENNEIADWVKEKDPALAFKLYDITDRREMIHAIESHLSKQGIEKDAGELKDEIKELKKELDTFEFSGFEKDL